LLLREYFVQKERLLLFYQATTNWFISPQLLQDATVAANIITHQKQITPIVVVVVSIVAFIIVVFSSCCLYRRRRTQFVVAQLQLHIVAAILVPASTINL
jgi:hypothetical protein